MNAPFGGGVGGGGDGGADEWAAAATTQNLGNARDISLAGSEMDDDSLAGSRSQELGGAPFSAGGGSRRFTDASSIEMMRGVDDAEGRFSSVGGRDSFLGGANEEDLGMTDLEPVAQADLLPPDLPEDDFAPAYAPEDDETTERVRAEFAKFEEETVAEDAAEIDAALSKVDAFLAKLKA